MGRKCCFHSQRATLHVPVLRYTYTCTYAYSAGDTNSYGVHGMEQDSEIERLRKRQATTPHRPVGYSRRSGALWLAHAVAAAYYTSGGSRISERGGGQSTSLGGSGGMRPQKFVYFRPSEVVSGAFWVENCFLRL